MCCPRRCSFFLQAREALYCSVIAAPRMCSPRGSMVCFVSNVKQPFHAKSYSWLVWEAVTHNFQVALPSLINSSTKASVVLSFFSNLLQALWTPCRAPSGPHIKFRMDPVQGPKWTPCGAIQGPKWTPCRIPSGS